MMKAFIFNGSNSMDESLNKAHDCIEKELSGLGYRVCSNLLRSINISPCIGCFDCWLKTPGICMINDAGRKITQNAASCDVWVFITPLTFGGYSSELKKAIDRLLPLFVPIFTNVDGEVHHRLRYDKHPIIVALGGASLVSKDHEDVFNRLVGRNAKNFRSPQHSTEIIYDGCGDDVVAESVRNVLSKAGIVR